METNCSFECASLARSDRAPRLAADSVVGPTVAACSHRRRKQNRYPTSLPFLPYCSDTFVDGIARLAGYLGGSRHAWPYLSALSSEPLRLIYSRVANRLFVFGVVEILLQLFLLSQRWFKDKCQLGLHFHPKSVANGFFCSDTLRPGSVAHRVAL